VAKHPLFFIKPYIGKRWRKAIFGSERILLERGDWEREEDDDARAERRLVNSISP
jgi:hypothetical protein